MVIGSHLYQIAEPSFGDDYIFNQIDEYSIDNHKRRYPIYSARYKNNNKNNDETLNLYRNVIP